MFRPFRMCQTPTPIRINPAAPTIHWPPGQLKTPAVVSCWELELDCRSPVAKRIASTASAM